MTKPTIAALESQRIIRSRLLAARDEAIIRLARQGLSGPVIHSHKNWR